MTHSARDRQRYPWPFFMSEHETAMLDSDEHSRWLAPSWHISREQLMQAIVEVESLCRWLEEHLMAVRYLAVRRS